jgi:hypothetical protein
MNRYVSVTYLNKLNEMVPIYACTDKRRGYLNPVLGLLSEVPLDVGVHQAVVSRRQRVFPVVFSNLLTRLDVSQSHTHFQVQQVFGTRSKTVVGESLVAVLQINELVSGTETMIQNM